jgi:hypothetical protein
MTKYKYESLMSYNPFELGAMTNSIGQAIRFVEHPTKGEDNEVIAVCDELQLAFDSGFYEIDDMVAEHREYEPLFINGTLQIGK